MAVNFVGIDEKVDAKSNTVEAAERAPLRKWPLALLLILGPILLLVLYSHRMVAGLVSPDAMDYAQLGRNLLAGHGLTTQILRPLGLTDSVNPLSQPDLTHGPLYPFLLALAFGLAGVKDGVVLGMSGLFYLLTAPALYFLGKRLFSAHVGMLAALVFITNGGILEHAAAGTPTTLVMFLATCLFLALFQAASRARREGENETAKSIKAPLVVAGLLAGLLYLTDPLLVWILPVLTIAIPLMLPAKSTNRRAAAAGSFLVPLALLTLPAMLRFFLLTGNPLFGLRGAELWMGTKAYPGFVAYRLSSGDIVGGFGSIKGILLKLFVGATGATTSLLHMPAGWVLLFVLPGLFFGFADPALGRLRTIVFACLISVLVGSLFLTFTPAVWMVVFPGLLVFALRYLVHLVRQAQLPHSSRVMVNGLFGFALLSPLVVSLVTTLTPASAPQVAVARSLNRQSKPDEVVFSDQPWVVAWYADRPSVWIPVSDAKMAAVRKQFVNARWLFLTPEAARLSPEWNMTFNSLMRWERQYQEAVNSSGDPPQRLTIIRNEIPITEALEGFEALPPTESGLPTVVLAVAPQSKGPSNITADKPGTSMMR